MSEKIREGDASEIGPTGEFPAGKLTADDQGGLNVGVAVYNGKIIIKFGIPIEWFGMDADMAEALGEKLIELAGQLRS